MMEWVVPLAGAGIVGIGGLELIVLVLVGMLLFGRRLPEVGRNVGKTITEFKKGISEATRQVQCEDHEEQALQASPDRSRAAKRPAKRLASASRQKQLPDVGEEP